MFANLAITRSLSLSSQAQAAIKNLAVVGGGQMGTGIAQVAAIAGQQVVISDVSEAQLTASKNSLRGGLARLAKKKHKEDPTAASAWVEETIGRVRWVESAEEASAGAELVVEAILEDLQVKRDLFARIDSAAPPSTILASNTSSLAISHIAEATKRPERFVGLHFFNPVPVMKLLEVVRTEQSNSDVVQAVSDWGVSLGKTVVPCKDTPGFIVNRLLVPFLFEAVRMVERGDAKPEDVDVAMKLGAGHPMGPFELFDYIGHDTMDLIMQGWSGRYPEETLFARSPTVQRLVSEGKLGKKTGEGFYKY